MGLFFVVTVRDSIAVYLLHVEVNYMDTQTDKTELNESPSDSKQTEVVEAVEEVNGEAPETEAQPEPETVPKAAFLREKNKYKARAQEAEKTAEQLKQDHIAQLEAIKQENELLKTALGGGSEKKQDDAIPLEYDYDDPAEYRAAMQDYIAKESSKNAQLLMQKQQQEQQETLQQQQLEQSKEKAIHNFYEKAAQLGASDFSEVEDEFINLFGQDLAVQVMEIFDDEDDDPAALAYHLGKNPKDAKMFLQSLNENPAKGLKKLSLYAYKLGEIKSDPTPAANDELPGGSDSGTNWDAIIEAKREKARTGEASWNDVMTLKKKAKESGWVEH